MGGQQHTSGILSQYWNMYMEALDLLAKNMVFVKMFAFNAEFLNELARLLHPITPRVTV